jgi:hypothetical protein
MVERVLEELERVGHSPKSRLTDRRVVKRASNLEKRAKRRRKRREKSR